MSLEDDLLYREIPEIVERGAKDGRDCFIAYMRQGFTEEEALKMVIRPIIHIEPELRRRRWWKGGK